MSPIEFEQDHEQLVVWVFGQRVSTFERNTFGSNGLEELKEELTRILQAASPNLLRSGDPASASFLPMTHEPMWGPRAGHTGEKVFLACWQAWLNEETETSEYLSPADYRIADVLAHYPYPLHQRQANVLASLVTWFGTSIGGAFLRSAKTLMQKGIAARDAYSMAWSMQNQRVLHVNHGVRTIENCLAPSHLASKARAAGIMDLSVLDYEAAECLMSWLGTEDGQGFLDRAEAALSYYQALDSCRYFLGQFPGLTDAAASEVYLMADTALRNGDRFDAQAAAALGLPEGGPQNTLCSLVNAYLIKEYAKVEIA